MKFTPIYPLEPNEEQIAHLEKQLREACRLYNRALQERRLAWETSGRLVTYPEQSRQLPRMRAEGIFTLNAQVAQNVLRRLDREFRGAVRRGDSLPECRSEDGYNSITFPQYPAGSRVVEAGLHIHGAGVVPIKLDPPINANDSDKIKAVVLRRDQWFWSAQFCIGETVTSGTVNRLVITEPPISTTPLRRRRRGPTPDKKTTHADGIRNGHLGSVAKWARQHAVMKVLDTAHVIPEQFAAAAEALSPQQLANAVAKYGEKLSKRKP